MSVITANPPPDDGGEGGGLAAPKPGPKVLSVSVEYPDDWTIEQVAEHQKHFYKKLAKAAAA
jgi:hypothetical protein